MNPTEPTTPTTAELPPATPEQVARMKLETAPHPRSDALDDADLAALDERARQRILDARARRVARAAKHRK